MCFDTRNTNYKSELNVLIQLPPMHAKNNHLNLSKRSCMILSIYTASMEDAEKFSIQTSQCADLLCTHKSCIYSVCTTKNTNIARCLLYMCIDRPAGHFIILNRLWRSCVRARCLLCVEHPKFTVPIRIDHLLYIKHIQTTHRAVGYWRRRAQHHHHI